MDVEDTTGEGGIDMIPAVIGGAILAGSLLNGVGQLVDNRRYWAHYYRNTGRFPLYRWKSGYKGFVTYGTNSLNALYRWS